MARKEIYLIYVVYQFDIPDETILRATTKVKTANKLLGIRLPYEDGDTLYNIITIISDDIIWQLVARKEIYLIYVVYHV